MPTIYARNAKISNAKGRSKYINDEEQQEEIVFQKQNMLHSWEEHSAFEKTHQKTDSVNNEALEVHIKLDNSLYQDKEKLEKVCDDLTKEIVGDNKDYEYSVHWNKDRSNLHVHILFSERENQSKLEPKIYKRDIYYNFEEKKLSKKSDPKATIIHHKGEVQKDKDGNIKYQSDIFKAKDTQYKERRWIHDKNKQIQEVFKKYGFDFERHDGIEKNPYLSQKKLYKGASSDYIERAKEWNKEIKEYNKTIKDNLDKLDIDTLVQDKKEIYKQVNLANKEEKKITLASIGIIRQWKDRLITKVKELTFDLKEKWNEMIQKDNEWLQLFFKKDRVSRELDTTDLRKIDIVELKNQFERDIKGVDQWRFKDRKVMKTWASARMQEWNRRFDLKFSLYLSFKHGWSIIEQKALEINSKVDNEKEALKQEYFSIDAQMKEKAPLISNLKKQIEEREPDLYACGCNLKRDNDNRVYVITPRYLPFDQAKKRLKYKEYYKDLVECVKKNTRYVAKSVKSIPKEELTMNDRYKLAKEIQTERKSIQKEIKRERVRNLGRER